MKALYLDPIFLNPGFYVAVALILSLELVIPAKKDQRPWSVGLAQDFVWLLIETGLKSLVVITWMRMIATFYIEHLSALTFDAMYGLPTVIRVGLSVVLVDFFGWFQHWLRHKVPWFWEFHKIHHAQTRLNLFTDARLHIVDWTVAQTTRYVLMLMLGVPPIDSVYFELLAGWYTRAYHANLRTNLGPFRYVIVSPQFHRIHHSIDGVHRDKNFAVLFPIWDHLFGTKHPDDDEYPDTGIADLDLPVDARAFGPGVLTRPLLQIVHPFRAIATSARMLSIVRGVAGGKQRRADGG